MYHLGMDIGSTTAKVAVLDDYHQIVFKRYRRHHAKPAEALTELLGELRHALGDIECTVAVTGTAGMGIAERTGLPFTQEVIASALFVEKLHPQVRTLIDIGGEDGKIILFKPGSAPTIRMNGNCAGGTGAFIDQMASLLGIETPELNDLATHSKKTYPMASRCGVFAKTDVQTLIARHIPKEDVVASVYRAVAFQTVSSLAHGADLLPRIMFAGGPLTFQPELRTAFLDVLGLHARDVEDAAHGELVPAIGAALYDGASPSRIDALLATLAAQAGLTLRLSPVLEALFESPSQLESWTQRVDQAKVPRISISDAAVNGQAELFLGIDCGSRTLKVVFTDNQGRLIHGFYASNDGDPLGIVRKGIEESYASFKAAGVEVRIVASAATGYGEELLKGALGLDYGFVETMAHFRSAQAWEPDVSFILDIGGQDIKALYIENRVIQHIELNEACSSGTGSFIETFANTLGFDVRDFAQQACLAKAPSDLGSRCTVFMNSKVKQSLREGASPGEISAGLAYSVVKNCFQKVLKIHNPAVLGKHVVVQGGTFKNPAVLRALEKYVGMEVLRPDIAELMGAYGAALLALDETRDQIARGQSISPTGFIGLDRLADLGRFERDELTCKGCENNCAVQRLRFGEKRVYYTGHKCERYFGNRPHGERKGASTWNLATYKRTLLFDRSTQPVSNPARARIGLPRVLNMYENYPFWCTLFTQAGFEVIVSDQGNAAQAESGYSYVMSENICFPAKLVSGHILNLVAKKVDRIFFPMVRHEKDEYPDCLNSFNCPVVTGYPQVVESAIDPAKRFGIPFDMPPFSFRDDSNVTAACVDYLATLGVDAPTARQAVRLAKQAQSAFTIDLRKAGTEAFNAAKVAGQQVVLLMGRPYHADPVINHRIPEIIEGFDTLVLTEDSLPYTSQAEMDDLHVLTQWAYPNRFYDAALWAANQDGVEVVQLNSFGCGPDALTGDEVRSILQAKGKYPTLVRIDEVSSPGAIRLRIRSMLESIRRRGADYQGRVVPRISTRVFTAADQGRTILAPMFSPFYTDFIVAAFRDQGYKIQILPMPDHDSRDTGLATSNHDICYPATLVVGDLIKALQSGLYHPADVALAITQTGGQCRASSYSSILKRALIQTGFQDVPVVTLATGKSAKKLNEQPGFHVSMVRMGFAGFFGILYADTLAKLFYVTRPRENQAGASWALVEHYIALGVENVAPGRTHRLFPLLKKAVKDFAALLQHHKVLPRVGLVGEIYVKFNPFANGYICDQLMDMGIEPDVPPLINFFLQKLVTADFNHAAHVEDASLISRLFLDLGEGVVNGYTGRINAILSAFPLYITPFHDMQSLAADAQKILSLINQYGESWLIAGDIGAFHHSGVDNVVCLQPFGCIANHIIAKGVERKLKSVYPKLNLLFLDMDAGASEVNITNRLEFLVRQAKAAMP